VILQAFDMRVLQTIKQRYPMVRTALMVDGKEEVQDYIDRLGFIPDIYSPYFVLIGKSLVDKCHEMGMKVVPWTVNAIDKVHYFRSLGVDGIVTDYPNLRNQLLSDEPH
jgi:glycerophosphoryl diester phosphodiesterase